MADFTLAINITSVDSNTKLPNGFSIDTDATTAENATVDPSTGTIGLSNVDGSVEMSWTFADSTAETFRPVSGQNQPITFSPARGQPGNTGVFGDVTLSNGNKTATLVNQNPDAQSRGSNNQSFTYVIHESNGPDDPSIQNR